MLCLVLSALSHFDLSQVITIRKLCFSWITDILNSRHVAVERYRMAGKVVELVWKHIKPKVSHPLYVVGPVWTLPLLRLLQPSEEFYSAGSQSAPGALALWILSNSPGFGDFGSEILPILTSTLLPTHPLQSRKSSLMVFHQFVSGWFSLQMENVSDEDRARFIHAVGDPFQSTPDIPPLDEQHVVMNGYEPMKAAVVLVEFASSGLWRDHLRRSNFTSCEEVVSTVEGKVSALKYMRPAGGLWPKFLYTPTKTIAAIERLEELQCPNTAEVVFMWAWTSGVVNPIDHDTWSLIGSKTLAFYRAHGTRRLKTLSRCIMGGFPGGGFQDTSCRVGGVRLPVRIAGLGRRLNSGEDSFNDLPLTQVCQLRRLCQLFRCDPTTWKEMLGAETVDEGADVSSGQSLSPTHLIDCTCDYP